MLIKQKQYTPLSVAEMALSLFAANEGYLDDVDANKVVDFEAAMHDFARTSYAEFLAELNASGDYNDDIVAKMKDVLDAFKSTGVY